MPEQYLYDELNRLISVKYENGREVSYSYDDAGNQVAVTVRGGTTAPVQAPQPAPALQPAAATWFYLLNGQQAGPVSERDMQQWLAQGRLAPDTQVWNPALPGWLPARSTSLLAARLTCPRCGNPVTPGSPVCGTCGTKIG